jgi:hypothetical protein
MKSKDRHSTDSTVFANFIAIIISSMLGKIGANRTIRTISEGNSQHS